MPPFVYTVFCFLVQDTITNMYVLVYDIRSKPKGYVLIINNESFGKESKFQNRVDSNKDCENLKMIFKKLGYKVLLYRNLSYREFVRKIECFSQLDDHWLMDCCIVCAMSHGYRDTINPHAVDLATTDNRFVSTDWIKEQFNSVNCRGLMNKPKILIFEACRNEGPKHMKVKRSRKLLWDNNPPHISDMICICSCLPGGESFNETKHGSCFVQDFCEVIKNKAKTSDLISILNKVDMKLRQRGMPSCQAVYIENWSFNKLLFLSDRAVKDFITLRAKVLGKKKEGEKSYQKPQAARPLYFTRDELKNALKGWPLSEK